MKPRTLISWGAYRMGRTKQGWLFIEREDGRDHLGRLRWRNVPADEWAQGDLSIFEAFASALERREKIARRRRDARRKG